jgi:hypothetical protein
LKLVDHGTRFVFATLHGIDRFMQPGVKLCAHAFDRGNNFSLQQMLKSAKKCIQAFRERGMLIAGVPQRNLETVG